MNSPVNIVICASGDGSNFQAIVEACRRGEVPAKVVGLISNREKTGAIGRARLLDVPVRVLKPKSYRDSATWDQAMLEQLIDWRADWIVLAGFLALIGPQTLAKFSGHVVNSHPGPLPEFGGHGMYGRKVHEAVLAAKLPQSAVSVHLVDGEYDRGTILAQSQVPVDPGDTADQLEARVKAHELKFYPQVLANLLNGVVARQHKM